MYPCLIPVFNGEVLKIKSELIHASLSAISVKHHYGKCYQEVEQEGTESNDTHSQSGEQNDYDVSDLNEELSLQSLKPRLRPLGKAGAGEASSAEEIKGKFENTALMLPNCMRQNINVC